MSGSGILRYWIFKRRDRPGKFILEWVERTRRGPRKRNKTFDTEGEAQAEADRLTVGARAAAGFIDDVLLREYAQTWFKRIRANIRQNSANVYAWAVDSHIVPWRGDSWLRELTPGAVKDFFAAKRKAGLSKNTVGKLRSVLYTLLEEAVADGILARNPARFPGQARALSLTPTRAERRAKVKAFTAEQLGQFLTACATAAPQRLLFFRTMAMTGVRPGEALALQWDDVDLGGRTVLVRRGFTDSRIEPTKTGEERTVDLGQDLAEALKAWDAASKAAALAAGRPRAAYLFPSADGRPVAHKRMEREFKAAVKAAGLPPHHTPHCLRHTYASLQLVRGVSIYYVQKQLGHATITMTIDYYGSWLPAGNREHADALERQLSGASQAPSDSRLTGDSQQKSGPRNKRRP